jgi:hypothetical protein
MTIYYTNLDTDPIGVTPVTWTSRNGANATYTPQYSAPAVKERVLLMTATVSADNVATQNSIDADANRANFDLLTCIKLSDMTTLQAGLVARGSGTTSFTGYSAVLAPAGNSIKLQTLSAGVSTLVVSVAFTFVAGANYFLRFRGNGTTIQAKTWLATTPEPTAWNISVTDSTFTAAGSVGFRIVPTATGQTTSFNFLSSGTNGDTAPTPLTNLQYTAWLSDQTQMREVLFEASLTGYNAGVSPFTKTVNAYFSKHGFTSKPGDVIPSKYYSALIKTAPTFVQKMPTAYAGLATTGLGAITLFNQNGVANLFGTEAGLDAMTRVNFRRSFARVLFGAPAWPRYDFRTVILGRMGKPTGLISNEISVAISDLSDAFNVPLTTQKYSGGGYNGQYKAVGFYGGIGSLFEIPRTDDANLIYSLTDSSLTYVTGVSIFDTTTAGALVTLTGTSALSAINTTTGDFTSATPHGMTVNYKIQLFGPAPAPFNISTLYYVIAAGLTTTNFRLSATRGGAVILPTTTTGSTQSFYTFGFDFNASNATVQLANNPAGRVLMQVNGISADPQNIYDKIFYRSGLSADFLGNSAPALLNDISNAYPALFFGVGLHTCAEAFSAFANGIQSWYGFTAAGRFQYGRVKVPAATAKFTFGSADSQQSSMTLQDVLRPIDFSSAQVTYAPTFLMGGFIQSSSQGVQQGYSVAPAWNYGSAAIPLDNHPENLDANSTFKVNLTIADVSIFSSILPQIVALYQTKLGIFSSKFRLSAIEVEIGDTISVTTSRYGWKVYTSSDPASPDNLATIDATLCVVIGKTVNLDGGSFPIQLDLMRPIPGYFPTGDLN